MTKTYKIKRAFLEGTQRGYAVGVVLVGGRRADLSYYPGTDEGYRDASITVSSIDKFGQWLGRKGEWLMRVRGKTLTAERL